ncbi:MAG TPA: PQQ-binding-like beta-propeller repeat protein [Vicinamibacterales bacterium]|nr:PQQ-binding-like beta-propeller repeat protein [Vicinamibacterales bacterium]
MSCVYCDPKSRTMMVWWLTKGPAVCRRRGPARARHGLGIGFDAIISGVDVRLATTSCSALALLVLAATAMIAQSARSSDLRLFPVVPAWSEPLDRAVTASPAFAGAQAFFVDDRQVAAYDVENGRPTWTASGSATTRPATGDGLLFLAEPEHITALDQMTGAVAWRLPFSEKLVVPLVWDNGWLVAADVSGNVLAFRASDGTLIWRAALGVRVHAAPALAADRVYVPLEDNRVASLDVSTGAVHWTRALGGWPNEMLALDDRVYVGSDDNYFYCLLASTGEVAWRWRTGGDVIGVPVVDDNRVYFVSRDNVLRGLDRRSGSQRWKRALQVRPTRGVVRAGDLLLVSGLAPRVTAFALKDGTPAGDITAPGELAAAPFVTTARGLPQVVLVARDVTKGTRVLAMRRTVEPPMNTPLPALPNPITIVMPGPPVTSGPSVATPH